MNSIYKQYKRKQKREKLTLVVQVTLGVVALLITLDVLGMMMWAISGQTPQPDMWYLGEFTSNLIR